MTLGRLRITKQLPQPRFVVFNYVDAPAALWHLHIGVIHITWLK